VAESKPWDSTLKRLIQINPTAFVKWLVPGAVFIKERPHELENQKREVDALLEIFIDGQVVLLHIEFQTYNDTTMAERLLLYNVLARSVYNLPVISCVIYLLQDGSVRQSPLLVTLPNGKKLLEFHFESVEIGQLSPEDILNLGIVALLPLLPLTKGGASRAELLRMFAELKKQREPHETEMQATELELIGYTLASLILRKNNIDLEWLIRRLREMHDIIREAPIYQEILREGREEGIERGLKEGLERGLEQGLEQGLERGRETSNGILLMLTQAHFPSLVNLLQKQIATIKDLEVLQELASKILSAKTVDEARTYILGFDKKLDV